MKRTSRRALIALATVGLLSLTSGCALWSNVTTQRPAVLSDGVSASVGDVGVRNLLVIGDEGKEGVVSGALVNLGTRQATVTVTTEGAAQPVQVPVPVGGLVTLGGEGTDATVVVGELKVPAGALMAVQLSSPAGGQVSVRVPVLPSSSYYATVTPPAN